MEVREPSPRYLKTPVKMTEIGAFPLDWEVKKIGELCSIRAGGDVDRGLLSSHEGPSHPYPIWANAKSSAPYGYSSMCQCPAESLTVTARGDIGHAVYRDRPYCAVGRLLSLVPTSRVSARFIAEFINARVTFASESTGVPQLTGPQIANYSIAIPCAAEETHLIAEALCVADTLIDSLEQLLTKKRQIKQGAMQELLTGKRRLPGFQQSWSEVRLGDVGRTYGGLTGKGKADFGHGASKYITFMNVMTTVRTSTEMVESVEVGVSESQNMVQPGDLLFNGSSETPEEVALCSWVESCDEGVFLNSFCFGFRPFTADRLSGLFMAYFFRGRPGRAAVSSLAQGATRYNIAKTALLQAPLCLPTFAEQQAIAEVLSSIDTEITALEARLTKARFLKQAMAQALLTGRIRLMEST